MKVGARITAATSALMAITLGAYAAIDLGTAAKDRRARIQREGRDLALSVRASIEATGVVATLREATVVEQEISRAAEPWQIAILPARLARANAVDPERTEAVGRLRAILDVRPNELVVDTQQQFTYVLPLRITSLTPDGYEIAGSLEVARPLYDLSQAWKAELRKTLPLLVVIVALTIFAITMLTRTLITRPIEKLLAGIDGVAEGDLSRVLLSERDDEIGTLATRFNEMTFSLRESRAETERHNEAKLHIEQRLSQTEKMATLGQLAAEIAHEVGTPLNVIAGRARSLSKKGGNPDVVRKNATTIAEQADRITRIIQRLMDLTRRTVGTTEPERVNLNEITLTTMEFLEGQFASAGIKTTLARTEALQPVIGEPDRVQQVLLNLLVNSIQAMPDGGTLRVETSMVTRRRPGLEMAPEQVYVLTEIIDSGIGISEEDREKIFEPFYTSRSGKGGTGLGLAVCFGIVKEHDGWIEVESRSDNESVETGSTPGTTFRIYLPTASATNGDTLPDENHV